MPAKTLGEMSSVELHRELERRAGRIDQIKARRDRLIEELGQLEMELEVLSGTSSRTSKRRGGRSSKVTRGLRAARTRAANNLTLAQALRKALQGKTLGVAEAAKAVQADGYNSNAKDFRTVVNLTLLKRKDLFSKKGRGRYTAA